MALYRWCAAIRKPVDIFVYVLLTLNVFASGSLKAFLHHWRWFFVAIIAFALMVQLVHLRSRKLGLQGMSHA